MKALETQNLSFAYSQGRVMRASRENAPLLLCDVNLAVEEGKIVALLGCSGIGKSTLLRLLAGLLVPTSGKALLFGHPPDTIRSQGKIGFVPQGRHLMPWMSVRKNILYPASSIDPMEAINDLAAILGIGAILDQRPSKVSGGEQTRAAFARALVRKPRLLLLDEPFSSIDPHRREQLWDVLRRASQSEGATAIFTTHDVREALAVADIIAVLSKSSVEQPAKLVYSLESDPVLQSGLQREARSTQEAALRAELGA